MIWRQDEKQFLLIDPRCVKRLLLPVGHRPFRLVRRLRVPMVTEKNKPLTFRSWRAGDELIRGVLNIPVPLHGEELQAELVIAPVVGFDALCYRLGFGGGYFDRTLAVLHPKPLVIGVGFDFQEIDTIRPQHHDIPMDAIVTDGGIRFREGNDAPITRMFKK
ncbi:5-formyltetrahydrofolate cyclo-ligase [Rhizobium sp. PL01]|uniref:5-formyltetrahydrofolate cyclo-ligase n=1 Tax=Rhizobium sp. PL01 TaxID=3085631 RepID=UPI002980BA98|nr:5-formyltetrahydrofolate cyclo-ligase [Rhizobium sp. PL01]MDW5318365.1 5-formyltetrahydrofolate cyclo-ligase [Rhizobium sp. PL01]